MTRNGLNLLENADGHIHFSNSNVDMAMVGNRLKVQTLDP